VFRYCFRGAESVNSLRGEVSLPRNETKETKGILTPALASIPPSPPSGAFSPFPKLHTEIRHMISDTAPRPSNHWREDWCPRQGRQRGRFDTLSESSRKQSVRYCCEAAYCEAHSSEAGNFLSYETETWLPSAQTSRAS
jgi:hypothetical protein